METDVEENRGYFVTNSAGQKVEVCFETLTADDLDALNGDDWRGARFGAVWKEWAEHEIALKLVRCDGSNNAILGVVKIGVTSRLKGGTSSLRDSLLETAPIYRYDKQSRQYHGIGRILAARLIAASKAQGAEGRLRIRPSSGSIPFYLRLGFVPTESEYYGLNADKASHLLRLAQSHLE